MHPVVADIQRLLARWRLEHAQVAQAGAAINLQRARIAGVVLAALSALHVLIFSVQLLSTPPSGPGDNWKLALILVHLGFSLSMALCAWAAHQLRYASNSTLGRGLPVLLSGLGLVFAVAITAIDQWVTPNITPYLIGAVAIALVVYLRPVTAAYLFLGACGFYYYALGLTQADPNLLLSNRVNGLTVSVLGWALSLLLWRKFTTITLQQAQLDKASEELQSKQKELQRLTRLDGLTGLYNRNTFVELTRQELARAQRQGSSTTILLLDLDYFKHVNDTWGHPAGDAVLKNVASVTNNSVRNTDLVGRLGGEEFIILLPNTSWEAGRKLAEKLRASLENAPATWGTTRISTTVSIGLASTTASENRDFDHLYTQADKALYSAKERGRNRVV